MNALILTKLNVLKNVIFVLLSILFIYTYGYAAKEWHLFLGLIYGVILYGSFDLIDIIEKYE